MQTENAAFTQEEADYIREHNTSACDSDGFLLLSDLPELLHLAQKELVEVCEQQKKLIQSLLEILQEEEIQNTIHQIKTVIRGK